MVRRFILALAGALLVLAILGCAHGGVGPASPEPTPQLAEHVARNLAMLHARLYGHATLPDQEWVRCLRAEWHGDTIRVIDTDDAVVTKASARRATFSCLNSLIETGAWGFFHPHLPTMTDRCEFSPDDIATQESLKANVMLVSCGTRRVRFISRVRRWR